MEKRFFNLYSHDFARVAVASPRCRVADPAFNVQETLRLAREAASAALEEAAPAVEAEPWHGTQAPHTPEEAAESIFHATEGDAEIVSADPPKAAQIPEYDKKTPERHRG